MFSIIVAILAMLNTTINFFPTFLYGGRPKYFIFLICFYGMVKALDTGTLSESLSYTVDSDIQEELILYHPLSKRETNSSDISNQTVLENYNLVTTETPKSTKVEVVKNSTESSLADSPNSEYKPEESEDEEGFEFDLSNGTITKPSHHRYYNSFAKSGFDKVLQYWVDLEKMPKDKVVAHDSLSSAYRRALTVSLTFDFPFYGHTLHNITIATGGFLYTGPFLHKWLAATQYIAPLMANFDTSVSPEAKVKYADNGTSLTVQWEKVVLQDNPSAGSFTFQVTIHKSGHIVFAYKDIPVLIPLIKDKKHPVKVGLSDAYIEEKMIFYVRKKTIYEYHKIDMKRGMQINNWTAIVFEPLTLCVSLNTCSACLTSVLNFKCEWCQKVGRCSDGLDRYRQIWQENKCENSAISNASVCVHLPPPLPTSATARELVGELSPAVSSDDGGHQRMWIGLFTTLVILAFAGGWVAYAYLHPHTPSGQILIKYRPSTWSWRRGEARYTAATMHSIHM